MRRLGVVPDPQSDVVDNSGLYAKRILPHVGLVCLLFAYLLIGATIFHAIEGPNELVDVDNRISREAFNSINQEYFEQLVKNIFVSYRNQFINEHHLMNKTKGEGLLWTYPNSIFFATTVITTIGYGNLVPTTTSGRVACIIFALFGIPLLLVTIADIGKFLSEFLSFLYKSYRAFKRKLIARRRTSIAAAVRSDRAKCAALTNLILLLSFVFMFMLVKSGCYSPLPFCSNCLSIVCRLFSRRLFKGNVHDENHLKKGRNS
ncbi:Ion channel [Teladorsagia circumcincta]|uniref:Ion channel n=1 Tax=Teladorsagia circumcincta TaxID=45464 RepID=A0A2G9V0N4_TELCI|nr:Ion channel [Teladorsagia circumcincta]